MVERLVIQKYKKIMQEMVTFLDYGERTPAIWIPALDFNSQVLVTTHSVKSYLPKLSPEEVK